MQNAAKTIVNKFNSLAGVLKKKKLFWGIVAITGVALAGYLIFGGSKKASGDYLTDTVKKSTIASTISASGMVEPVSTISLSFKNSELIKSILVKVGDHVTTGQLLAEQDSDNLEAQVSQSSASLTGSVSKLDLLKKGPRQEDVEQARANVNMAQGSYDLAKSSLERYQKLFQEGAVARADLDKANLDYVNAEGKLKQAEESLKLLQSGNRAEDITAAAAQVESSRAQLQMVQNDLSGARMISPIDGIVSAVNGAVGQRATANNNNTTGGGFIVVISEALQIKAQINEADIGKTEVGQKVEFMVNSFPNKTFMGKLSSISPQAYTVSNVQIYDVIIQPDENYKELKAGMPANVTIIVDRHENTLTIPKGAVTFAVSYMNKMKQTGALKTEGSTDRAASDRPGVRQAGGSANPGSGSESNNPQETSGSTKGESQEQQATVLVMNKAGDPAPRRVVLGLSDMRFYEVVKGLNEGETVVVGSLSQPAAAGAQGNQSTNAPFMGTQRATGGAVRR